eukprot:CAMPEP_0184862080 /NCGR_PEP_ID=MMETSP0580-20130426/6610_1 /TAXON_ID=1118495 /ORGANISM="Dactyliosolen fragilissimus" /LENGTH=561 /DNA_ID=CAMNT_0027359803 /DNA_START=327 /DNA_END=2009 /DNA_ORIENTATION=+
MDIISQTDNLHEITDKIKKVEKELLSSNRKQDKPWFALSYNSLHPILMQRDQIQFQFYNSPTTSNHNRLREIRKIANTAFKDAKNRWSQLMAEKVMDIALDPCDDSVLSLIQNRPTMLHLNAEPSVDEIKEAIKHMRFRKAAGPSGLTPDTIKYVSQNTQQLDPELIPQDSQLSNEFINILHKIFSDFWHGRINSIESWQHGTLCPVPKKGNLSNPNKWRPVCLLECPYKILASIIAKRMNKIVRDEGLEEQCGSLHTKGCQDALFSLKSALQTRKEFNLPTDVLFVDLVKAFDTINHKFLFKVLEKYGYPPLFIDVIIRMYTDFSLDFSVGKVSKSIPYTIGVHQGDNLAPILFNIFFQAAVESLDSQWEENNIPKPEFRWHRSEKRGRLRRQNSTAIGTPFSMWRSLYVDDGAFLFNNKEDLSKGANIIFKQFKKFGLTMHVGSDGTYTDSKTEAVHFCSATEDYSQFDKAPVTIQDQGYITYADSFTYLGSKINFDLNDTFDVENRIKHASKALGAMMQGVFRNNYLSKLSKKMLYLAIPINLLLWGCETWALKREDW